MICKAKECKRKSTYKGLNLCQKHYFRFWRNGRLDKIPKSERKKPPKRKRKYRTQNAKGYQMIDSVDHPLAMKNGYVYEHRMIIYLEFGENLPPCECCGKLVKWKNYSCHIDHKDEDVTNNERSNLRVLCNGCNVGRTRYSKYPRYRNFDKQP